MSLSTTAVSRDLLIEIGTEELPPKSLQKLATALGDHFTASLTTANLTFGNVHTYATPRRLALLIEDLLCEQPSSLVEKRGPAVATAFDAHGNPSKATLGFINSCHTTLEALQRLETDKGSWLLYRQQQPGEQTRDLIPAMLSAALNALPVAKRMRWSNLDAEFVRPLHWILLLFGDELIEAEILSIQSGRQCHGHRFHHPEAITLQHPRDYAQTLYQQGKVVADFARRSQIISDQVLAAATSLGGIAPIDQNLLAEVTALVEWPVAVVGNFDREFLKIPPECLISAMKGHQKYFHLVDSEGKLLPHFITISNIACDSYDNIRKGNERVIRPRLADAAFFWQQDTKKSLASYGDALKQVIFQQQLGSLYDKSERITALAVSIGLYLGADVAAIEQAAQLCKCDLLTQMVSEFPELQGVMGRYYALHEGLPVAVATALDEIYAPRHAGDALPASSVGTIIALADRLDTLVGIFAIGQKPSGTKDPFALRRASLAVLRLIIEKELNLDLWVLLECSANAIAEQLDSGAVGTGSIPALADDTIINDVFTYILERSHAYYSDQGFSGSAISAVLSLNPRYPLDMDARIRAVASFRQLEAATALAAANKRIGNILKKSNDTLPEAVDPALFTLPAEEALYRQICDLEKRVTPLFNQRHYQEALQQLASLRQAVDDFFVAVMVNDENSALRCNRLTLLRQLQQLFLHVADLSVLS
ncbi:MAG: glycine--tRNA ligase subunit beta [Gammaproteobacteria bacterium]|nr:glycine--tRNA ligase subunit beta [Gammaproteobacteria bacterium]